MTPSALLSSSSTASAGNGSSNPATRSDNRDESSGFDKLLQRAPRGVDGKATNTAGTGNSRPRAATERSDTATPSPKPPSESADAAVEDGTAAANEETTTASTATTTDTDPSDDAAAAWPPLGLAGLLLSAGAPAPAAEASTLPAGTAALPSSPASAQALPAAGTQPAPLSAPAAAPSSAAASAAALPAVEPDAALPAAVQTLLASAQADADTATASNGPAPLLHALPGVGEVRPLLGAAHAVFTAEPTPTPTLGDAGFDEAISARVGWLADQKIGHAHIKISPDDLGTIDVRLQLDGDKVHATFSTPHVDVRQALESSLPRLRELLGEQGFQLAHADVGQQHSQEGRGDNGSGGRGNGGGDGEPALTSVSASQLIRQRGLLDTYA